MIRRRGQRLEEEEEESSDEEDAFAALSQKAKRARSESQCNSQKSHSDGDSRAAAPAKKILPISITSSMKRHHKPNDDRKAKMDALLQELEAEKQKVDKVVKDPHRFIPDKKGSFVDPSEEHLTTNIFVGNLAPSITEEDLTELFLQFGELYSIKIMWPRTPAERGRKRNTGFVCFMHREDAEEAMEACNESDPFNVGRLLMMRWGKNVKKNIRQGTGGGLSIHPLQREQEAFSDEASRSFEKDPDEISLRTDGFPAMIEVKGPREAVDISKAVKYEAGAHSENAIHVKAPSDPDRFHFISTVASFVAKDGSQLEQKLIETEHGNPDYDFLVHESSNTDKERDDHIFYRWRVYAFCQGDTFSTWRTEPFVMFHPNGRFWIPPPLDREASKHEKEKSEERSETIRRQKDQRAEKAHSRKELMTGRQIERARNNRRKGNRRNLNWDGGTQLSMEDRDRFNWLVRRKLTISRESICSAMAFCFEKSGAAQEIANLLKDTLMDEAPHVTVDMRIARLYLLSDILFNSQQPGVKNAFIYRDSLEKMAPDIFTSLGRHGSGQIGRMTMNKLKTAVSTVLGAWTEWSVYNPTFLDELEARFTGREIQTESKETEKKDDVEATQSNVAVANEDMAEVVIKEARGDWTEVVAEEEDEDQCSDFGSSLNVVDELAGRVSSEAHEGIRHLSPERLPGDVAISKEFDATNNGCGSLAVQGDGAEYDDLDGSPINEMESAVYLQSSDDICQGVAPSNDDIDGEPIEEDIDGEPMDEEDNNVEPVREQKVVCYDESLDADIDGEALDSETEDLDGVPLDEEEGRNACSHEDLDGEALNEDETEEVAYTIN